MKIERTRSVPRRGSAVLSLPVSLLSAVLIPASVVAIAMLLGAGAPAPVADAVVPADTTMLVPDRTEHAGGTTLYGIRNGFNEPEDNILYVIDPSNGDLLSGVQVTVPGRVVQTCNGLAIDPTDGEMYAVVRAIQLAPLRGSGPESATGASGGPIRLLVTLDRDTGVGDIVGQIAGIGGVAGIAFKADGTLIAVTGDGGDPGETLYEVDKTDASTTFVLTLGNGDDGEAIACHENGLLYHASGITEGDMYFESVDLDTLVVTDRSNDTRTYPDEVLALGYSSVLDAMYRTDRGAVLSTIDIVTGEATDVGVFPDDIQMKGLAFDEAPPPPPPGEGGVLEDGVRTIFLERGPAMGISPMNVVWHPDFRYYYASNGGDPAWSAWVYDEDGNRIQDLPSIGVDVRAWTYNPNIVTDNGGSGLEIISFDAQVGDGGNERGLIHPGTEPDGLLNGETTNVLAELPGLIDRQTAPSYDPARNVFYSRGLGTLVHVVDRDTGLLVDTFDLDFDAAGVIDSDVLGWSLGYDPDLRCLIAADQTNDRALVFELDGSYAGASNIDMDINRQWGVAYTNGQFFIWSDDRNGWQGYVIKVEDDPCGDCPCPEDIDRSGEVDFQDLVVLLSEYGPCKDVEEGAEPAGRLLGLSSTNPGRLYEIDPVIGEATLLTDLDTDASIVGLSCLGPDIFGSDLITQFDGGGFFTGSIDPLTGETTFVSNQEESLNWQCLATNDAAGLLYTIDRNDNQILKALDPETGVVTSIGGGTGGDTGRGMAYDDASEILYMTDNETNLYTVDTGTGVASLVGATGIVDSLGTGLAFDEVNRVLYLNDKETNSLYTVDVATGAATLVGENAEGPLSIDGLAWCQLEPCDACPCPADVNRDGVVDFQDAVQLLAAWGPCEPGQEECDDCIDDVVEPCGITEGICIECETPEGDCLCVFADVFCEDLQICDLDSGEGCPPGFFCCVNTCCDEPVCLPLCEQGVDAPETESETARTGGTPARR